MEKKKFKEKEKEKENDVPVDNDGFLQSFIEVRFDDNN